MHAHFCNMYDRHILLGTDHPRVEMLVESSAINLSYKHRLKQHSYKNILTAIADCCNYTADR